MPNALTLLPAFRSVLLYCVLREDWSVSETRTHCEAHSQKRLEVPLSDSLYNALLSLKILAKKVDSLELFL